MLKIDIKSISNILIITSLLLESLLLFLFSFLIEE